MKFIPKSWNDTLSVLLLLGIPALWVAFRLPDVLVGGTLSAWMLVVQYYFRKSKDEPANGA